MLKKYSKRDNTGRHVKTGSTGKCSIKIYTHAGYTHDYQIISCSSKKEHNMIILVQSVMKRE